MSLDPHALADELCGVFLGWRLGQDLDALLALEEGALRIDLLSGEAWCDGEPIPVLFIAGELTRQLAANAGEARVERAQLDAEFHARTAWARGEEVEALDIACRVTLCVNGADCAAERRRASISR